MPAVTQITDSHIDTGCLLIKFMLGKLVMSALIAPSSMIDGTVKDTVYCVVCSVVSKHRLSGTGILDADALPAVGIRRNKFLRAGLARNFIGTALIGVVALLPILRGVACVFAADVSMLTGAVRQTTGLQSGIIARRVVVSAAAGAFFLDAVVAGMGGSITGDGEKACDVLS